jgi:hypothetical protein
MAILALRNIWLKFLSICIATLLWLIVAGDRVVERALRVPIEFQNLPAGLEIVGEPPETVDIRLRASSGTLGRLVAGEMAAIIDLRSVRPGRRLFHLTAASIRVPYGVEVVQVAPATLPMSFENSAVRIVQVRPSIEGRPAPGYEVTSVTSRPATVEIVGPESSLRGFDEAMTEPISIANATRSIREVVTIGVADPTLRLRTPQTAEVTVQVVAGSATRVLARVPVRVTNLDNGLRGAISPGLVDVAVRGTAQGVEAVTVEVLQVFVDAAGLTPGDHNVPVVATPPAGAVIDQVTPATIRLRIVRQ